MLEAHVRAVDVVRPENQHAVEELAAVVDRHQLADDLAAAVGIARIGRVGHDERRALVGRHLRRRLIDLRARGENEAAHIRGAAGVEHIDHALDADVEHQLRRAVEEFGAVDEGEMVDLVDAAHRGVDGRGIADVAGDELDVALAHRRAAAARRASCRQARAPHGRP